MGLLDYGAGASEGLDRYLTRMMAQEQLAETARSHQAQEANVSRGLEQNDWLKQSLAEERTARTAGMADAQTKEAERQAAEDQMLKDPEFAKTPQGQWLKLRRVEPNAPFQLFQEGGGVNSEQKTGKLTDPNLAQQLGKKVGDVIDYDYNPRSLKKTFRGVDVTNGVDHYEKPPQPLFAPMQTGDEWSAFNRRTGGASPVVGADGQHVKLALTGQTRSRMQLAKVALPQADRVDNLADELEKDGLFGPAMSRLRHIAERAGSVDEITSIASSDPELRQDPLVGEFASSLPAFASISAQAHYGGNAGRSPATLAEFKQMLSDSGTIQMFHGRVKGMRNALNDYSVGPNGVQPQGGEQGGVPQVGGTFNGGKVLKVTPIQ